MLDNLFCVPKFGRKFVLPQTFFIRLLLGCADLRTDGNSNLSNPHCTQIAKFRTTVPIQMYFATEVSISFGTFNFSSNTY